MRRAATGSCWCWGIRVASERLWRGPGTAEGLVCTQIDEKRWLLTGAVAEAGPAYASFRHSIKGSVDKYLENAAEDDPKLADLDAAARRFREVYELLARELGMPGG